MKVENMINSRGNTIANQFIIRDFNRTCFQSYRSLIAEYSEDTTDLKIYTDWDYSRTTMKYLKQFINEETNYTYENKKQFEKLIEENENIIILCKADEFWKKLKGDLNELCF